MKTTLALAALSTTTAAHDAMPPRGACIDAGANSGCYYLLAADEYPAWVYVQDEYVPCLTVMHGRIWEDGSISDCPA